MTLEKFSNYRELIVCTTILYSLIILKQLSQNGKSDTSYRVIIKNSRKYIHVHKFLTFEHESRMQTNYFMIVLIRKCLINNYRKIELRSGPWYIMINPGLVQFHIFLDKIYVSDRKPVFAIKNIKINRKAFLFIFVNWKSVFNLSLI